jgi:hypothetical protein
MSEPCISIARAEADALIATIVRSIAARHGDTPEQTAAREHEATRIIKSYQPRDEIEIMLAGMIVTNFYLALHAASHEMSLPPGEATGKGSSAVVRLQRAKSALMKDLRLAQDRPELFLPSEPDAAEPGNPEHGVPETMTRQSQTAGQERRVEPAPRPPFQHKEPDLKPAGDPLSIADQILAGRNELLAQREFLLETMRETGHDETAAQLLRAVDDALRVDASLLAEFGAPAAAPT